MNDVGRLAVLIADDEALVRRGLRMILETEPDLEIVGEAEDGADAVALVASTRPDIVLMDVRMPGRGRHRGDTPHPRCPHVGRMLTKLGLRNRVQAVIFAYEASLVGPTRGQAASDPAPHLTPPPMRSFAKPATGGVPAG